MIKFRNFILFHLLILNLPISFSYGQSKTDSLLVALRYCNEDTNKVNILSSLCLEYNTKDTTKALKAGLQGLELSNKLSFYRGAIKCANNIATIYNQLGDYDKSTEFYLKSLKLNFLFHNYSGVALCNNVIGVNYSKKGNYLLALKYYKNALRIYQLLNDDKGIIRCFNDIGLICIYQKNYSNALGYFNLGLKIAKHYGDTISIVPTLVNMGIVYSLQKKYSISLNCFLKALNFSKGTDNIANLLCLNNIGNIYINLNDYPHALFYLEKALEIGEKYDDKYGLSLILNSLAELSIKTGKIENAIEYALKSIKIAKEIKALEYIKDASNTLSQCYSMQGDYKKAFEYQKYFQAINDSIYNITSSKQIKEIEAKYQNERKEKEIQILLREKEIQMAKIKQNRILQGVFIAGMILLLVISVLIYSQYRTKQKKILSEEKLKNKKEQLLAVIDAQEHERQRIARDLHDGIGQTLAGIKINFENIATLLNNVSPENNQTLNNASIALDTAYKEVRDLSHQMMPAALNEVGISEAISELLERTLSNSKIKFTLNTYSLNDIDKQIETALYRVSQELLNNIIRHANATKITVQLFKTKNEIILIFEDDGIGINQNINGVSKGIGLSNLESRIQALNGVFSIYPGNEGGTIASVRIPV